jgi:hypothetical protein
MKTIIVENIPKLLIGINGLLIQAENATPLVKEVTSIYMKAFLTTRAIRSNGFCLIALIHLAFCQQSWKTKMSSQPMPTIIMTTDKCILEK